LNAEFIEEFFCSSNGGLQALHPTLASQRCRRVQWLGDPRRGAQSEICNLQSEMPA
jgi:hypothetical protein